MASKRKTIHVKKEEIVEYWKSNSSKINIKPSWDNAINACWICGFETRVERCHIIPDCLGGEPIPSNLVLLCKLCHEGNPETIYYEDYLKWLSGRVENMTGMCLSGYDKYPREYKSIYGVNLDKDLYFFGFLSRLSEDDLTRMFGDYLKRNQDKFYVRYPATTMIALNKFLYEEIGPIINRNLGAENNPKVKLVVVNE